MERSYFTLKEPFRVHNLYRHPSWLRRFEGEHPEQAKRLMADIRAGRLDVELRRKDDVERLLDSRWYQLGRAALMAGDYVDRGLRAMRHPRWHAAGLAQRLRHGNEE
jgi:hypothetical protein